jgi:hypothetical protein
MRESEQGALFEADPVQPVRNWARRIYGPPGDAHHWWAVETATRLLDGRELPPYPGPRATGAERVRTIRRLLGLEEVR